MVTVILRTAILRAAISRAALAIAGTATILAIASRPVSAADGGAIVMASGALQQCLGISSRAGTLDRSAGSPAACRQLPGADQYDQAGVRYKSNDAAGAARLLTSAAQAGHPLAQLRLAMLYEAGQGVSRDKRAAMQWYARAAAQGEPASQAELGGYYEEADGVAENWDLAAALYRASATQGWMKGQFAYGRAYEFGIGVPQNRSEAVRWFRKAGAQGHAQAAYYARWLADATNNIGFHSDAEHDLVIGGKLRFALGAADPTGITFHRAAERTAWLQQLAGRVNASEAMTFWQMRRDEFDSCMRRGGQSCREPGPRPR